MTLEEAAAFVALDLMNAEDLPGLALAFLEQGFDSPSLCDLASRARSDDPRELRDLFHQVLRELKIGVFAQLQAAEILKRYFAREVVEGRMSPESGAFRIIHEVYAKSGIDEQPGRYYGEAFGIHALAGAYYQLDDFGITDPIREELKQDIVNACRDILDSARTA
jgi:hypothetical protein